LVSGFKALILESVSTQGSLNSFFHTSGIGHHPVRAIPTLRLIGEYVGIKLRFWEKKETVKAEEDRPVKWVPEGRNVWRVVYAD